MFWQLAERMEGELECALYVSNAATCAKTIARCPDIAAVSTLKEWEIFAEARGAEPDMDRLRRLQAQVGAPLWQAALADRRVFFGELCKVRQDYRSRYSEAQMLAIVDVAARRIDAFLEQERPDAVLGFGTATVGDFLFEVLCRRREISYGQLKATKIRNNVALFDSGLRASRLLKNAYAAMQEVPEDLDAEVDAYLREVRERGVKYEGAILFRRDLMLAKLRQAPRRLVSAFRADLARRRDPVQRNDPHIPANLPTAWYTNVVHPLRTFRLGRRLPLLGMEELAGQGDFAFYPMHFEPEVSLQVFGRPFQNQIEVVRNLALSLPVGTRLLVKEHPRSLGFRKESYYRRLLDIPNVRLVDPFMPTIEIVRRARLIAVVSGSVGLEAAIVGKPVLVLGQTPYTLMPETMVQQAGNLNCLSEQIESLMKQFRPDEDSLRRYVAALLSISVPVNLYTNLLTKQGRYADPDLAKSASEEYRNLARFLCKQLPLLVGN